jgi:hypothetical protein
MRLAGHVVHMGSVEMHTEFWLEDLNGRDRAVNPITDGRRILQMYFREIRLESVISVHLVPGWDSW